MPHTHDMNNLSHFRELRGLSQRELADMLGVSQPTIQRAEAEAPSAKLGTYKKCATILGITLADIFCDRSALEGQIVDLFRNIPDHKHPRLIDLLEIAQDPPSESAAEANQAEIPPDHQGVPKTPSQSGGQ